MEAAAATATESEPRRADLVLQHATLLTLDRATLQKLCGAEGVSTKGSTRELADRLCPVVPDPSLLSPGEVVLFLLSPLCFPHTFSFHLSLHTYTCLIPEILWSLHLPIYPTNQESEEGSSVTSKRKASGGEDNSRTTRRRTEGNTISTSSVCSSSSSSSSRSSSSASSSSSSSVGPLSAAGVGWLLSTDPSQPPQLVHNGGSVLLGEKEWHASWQGGHEETLSLSCVESSNDRLERTLEFVEECKRELEKRKEEVEAMTKDITELGFRCGESEDPDAFGVELARMCAARGNHKARICELEAMREAGEVDIVVSTVRRRFGLELVAGRLVDVSALGSKGEDGGKEDGDEEEEEKEKGVSVVWSGPMLGGRGVEAVVDVSEERKAKVKSVSLRGGCVPLEGVFVRGWGSRGEAPGEFQFPYGVAASGGEVFVCDRDNHRVQVFSREGVFLRQWGTEGGGEGQFRSPYGVAVTEGLVYVADHGNERVQVFDVDGVFQLQWGSYGEEEGQFNCPAGVAVSGGEVFVVDMRNHRVQVFGLDGVFRRQWGTKGDKEGQLNTPTYVAVHEGEVIVADSLNHRVVVFGLDGSFIRQWGSHGEGEGQFRSPRGVAVRGQEVIVADMDNQRVQVFGLDGRFVRQWGSGGNAEGRLDGPFGLAVDDHGNVLVADTRKNRIQVFR